jgi:biopolymer transport protein ExbD
MKKSFLKRKKRASSEMSLQITSMADIFMILLVFLLKNYATSITNITPTARMSLPELSHAKGVIKDTLKIEIARDIVAVDQKPAVKLRNFEFASSEGPANGPSSTVLKVLNQQRSLRPEPNRGSSVVVMADQQTPYSTIKRVVASAAQAGFVDLQLVVVDNE